MQKEESKKESVKLLCCPFCGGESSIVTYQGSKRIFYIECKDCKALLGNPRIMISGMKGNLYFENEAELIEAWNTRKPIEAVVAELEKESKEYTKKAEEHEVYEDYCTRYYSIANGIDIAIEIIRGKE